MRARIILHIGANKTGSSAIQDFLRRNWRVLRDLGYFIPDGKLHASDKVSGEHVFAFQQFINRQDRAGLQDRIASLATAGAPVLVFSAENLSNGSNYQLFGKTLADFDSKVILYIRRQDDFLLSSWQQWHSKTESDFYAWLILALQRYGHWQRLIDGWETVVGERNVTVRLFQPSSLVNGDIVEDFASLLDLPGERPPFDRARGPVNPSFSELITPIVGGSKFLFDNDHDNDFYRMVEKLTGETYLAGKKISLISAKQRDRIVEFYKPQNDTICRKYFPARASLFEPVDHTKYEYLTESELTRRQMQFLASLIYGLHGAMQKRGSA